MFVVATTTTLTVNTATAASFNTVVSASCSSPGAAGTILITPTTNTVGPYSFALVNPGAGIRPAQGSNIANTVNSIFTGLNQGVLIP
jgi:hypothetical protein